MAGVVIIPAAVSFGFEVGQEMCIRDSIRKAKSAIKKAFVNQISGEGFSMVEVLSTCPTNWKMTPIRALEWLEDNMIPYYPLINLRNPKEVE